MELTSYYGLKKPGYGDPVEVGDLNSNAEVTDRELHRLAMQAQNAAARLDALEALVNDYGLRIKALEDGIYTDITGNPFSVRFNTLEGVQVTGIWNKELQRMEC